MKFLIMLFLAGQVHADQARDNACKVVRHALVDIQNDDPDAFDAWALAEQGTVSYMCQSTPDGLPWSKALQSACSEARRLKCK